MACARPTGMRPCGLVLLAAALLASAAESSVLHGGCAQNRCDACLSNPDCGWCTTTWTCMYGNATGPQAAAPATAPLPCAAPKAWVYGGGDTSACVPGVTQVQDPAGTPAVPLDVDIVCLNGGQRHYEEAAGTTGKWVGNTYCDCPEGWGGVDCSACLGDGVCSAGRSCTHSLPNGGSPAPHAPQRFSCGCKGKAEVFCRFFSGYVGSTRFVVDMDWGQKAGSTKLYGSVPRATPDIHFSALLADANMTDCNVTTDTTCPTGPFYNWTQGASCMEVTCKTPAHDFVYPAYNKVPACVNGGKGQACYVQTSSTPCKECVDYECWDRSWRYHSCWNPVLHVSGATFVCQQTSDSGGSYNCAWSSQGTGPLTLQCTTGTCV